MGGGEIEQRGRMYLREIGSERIENIRDNLVNLEKAKVALDKLIAEQPSVDVQKLRQLIRNHNKEVEKDKPRKSFKEIFQLLRAVYKS